MDSRSVITLPAVTLAALLSLTACAGQSDQTAAEAPETTEQQSQPDDGVTVEPGLASCTFNNELGAEDEDGDESHSLGSLEIAELRETDEAYEVTMTGDFFDPEAPFLDEGVLTLNLQLHSSEPGDDVVLLTDYQDGELDFSGAMTSDTTQETYDQDTGATLEPGTFTATYPKGIPALDDIDPSLWVASVYFDVREKAEGSLSESVANGSFRCGDGRSWEWQPLDAQ